MIEHKMMWLKEKKKSHHKVVGKERSNEQSE
jgi:hypothetical protein